jgi:hemoglobin-like flavoprotein
MSLDVNLLRQSFELIAERNPDLTGRFYQVLFERYPQTQKMFPEERRARQRNMLKVALIAVLEHLEDSAWRVKTLGGLGAGHVRYGVTDEMYDWVGESLLVTLAEAAGDDWTPEVAREWTRAYLAIAGLMQSGARAAVERARSEQMEPAPMSA